jgi:hypothetical protein
MRQRCSGGVSLKAIRDNRMRGCGASPHTIATLSMPEWAGARAQPQKPGSLGRLARAASRPAGDREANRGLGSIAISKASDE